MSGTPTFSVVTVTFRNRAGLAATRATVLAQDFTDFEWIVIDGGSTDGTAADLAACADPRLSWVSEPDAGIFDAMSKGLARATGRYTIFMNAGDRFADDAVLAAVAAAIGGDAPDLIYGDALEADGDLRFYKPARSPADNRYVMFTHHQAQFYRTDAARAIGYDLSYRLSADWVLTTRVLARPAATMRRVPRALCIFERGGVSQQGGRHRATANAELFRIYRREQHHPLPRATALWLKKVGINKARSLFPGLYDRIRYRRPPAAR